MASALAQRGTSHPGHWRVGEMRVMFLPLPGIGGRRQSYLAWCCRRAHGVSALRKDECCTLYMSAMSSGEET